MRRFEASPTMTSVDTNILYPAVQEGDPNHAPAYAFVESLKNRDDVAISEFLLLELYNLLRNPAMLSKPFSAAQAVEVCHNLRIHPRWRLIGFPADSRRLHDELWEKLRAESFARRRLYDLRTALTLVRSGVTEFATVNTKDFRGIGFNRVWNPLRVAV
jgi:predicted nucleic acid-binding protein